MSLISNWFRSTVGRTNRAAFALLVMILAILPSAALASGAEASVKLDFTPSDMNYLYASGVMGLIAIAYGFMIRGKLLSQSPGDEAMQSVGGAIREGAMAYLKKQFSTMLIFVVIVAAALFAAYQGTYGPTTAAFLAVSFVAGVLASYVAGYVGMKTAIDGNMRTAHAALSSYKLSLETAFKSGAVAGMLTVGLGLIGATIIFLLGKGEAMKLLVGFGFGGSLAALFMRVGGGIFTKAADVGADLVGKVEAGIPEDDPRNPAVIADNVGDNVGDCAGMAADIFESYEVTLVAAIVLGAATSSIFDTPTWMRLILFALVARGIGIIASIVGINMVKGTDDLDSDPLKPITRGFMGSAAIAAVLTAIAAFLMMGGDGKAPIKFSNLKTQQDYRYNQLVEFKQVQGDIAVAKYKGDQTKVTAEDLKDKPILKKYELDEKEKEQELKGLLAQDLADTPKPKALEGYAAVDLTDTKSPIYNYAVQKIVPTTVGQPQPTPEFDSLGKVLQGYKESKNFAVLYLEVEQKNAPTPQNREDKDKKPGKTFKPFYWGPVDIKAAQVIIKNAREQQKMEINEKGTYEAVLLANKKGELAWGVGRELKDGVPVEGTSFTAVDKLQPAQNGVGLGMYYKGTVEEVNAATKDAQTPPAAGKTPTPMPKQLGFQTAGLETVNVGWWRFAICILFGILMAFGFERLTDYYVSLHKKPVMETAMVSNAGPAPMIIQGFSYGLESSVFSVVLIVVALLAPLGLFPPTEFGGPILSFYGIALVGLGLLTTTGFILAMDTFGPISDNAQGVFEMSGAAHANPEAAKAVQRLDAAGNTTKALTKGFAIATAVVAAVALFHSYVQDAMLSTAGMPLEVPHIFLGLLIGAAAPYLFSAFSINAVGRAAFELINEVRRQFREDKGIMAGTSKPNYAVCVEIVTKAAQRELIGPGILAIFLPVAVAFGFSMIGGTTNVGGVTVNLNGAQALGGFLVGTIASGQLLAVMLANSGGLWDNAKKLIEDGMFGGKGSDAHRAGVVCDTVGDPFKDTAGPALNPLIKVMNLVALLIAPIIIQPWSKGIAFAIFAVCMVALIFAIWWSKRGSMATGMAEAGAVDGPLPGDNS